MKARGRLFFGTVIVLAGLSGCESAVSGTSVTVAIIDDSTAPGMTYDSVEQVGNAPFRDFVAGVLSDATSGHFIGTPRFVGREEADHAALVFLRVPVATSGNEVPPPLPEPRTSMAGCRLQSPWFDLTVHTNSAAGIEGLFVWNERQILQDQAFLAGETGQPTAPRLSLPQSTFQELAQLYARQAVTTPQASRSDDALERSVPPDVLFLFRRAPQSTRGPFASAARNHMQRVAQDAVAQQVSLAKSMLDRCRGNDALHLMVANAKEAANIISN